jgi:type VI protein secretion system component VasK
LSSHNPVTTHIALLLTGTVVVVAMGLGLVFLFTDLWAEQFSANRELAGGLFVVYGCYRGFRGWQRYRMQKEKEENEAE